MFKAVAKLFSISFVVVLLLLLLLQLLLLAVVVALVEAEFVAISIETAFLVVDRFVSVEFSVSVECVQE